MKDIFAVVGKILGLVFAASVIGYTAYLTFMLAQRIVPGNTILQVMTIVLFDIGALTWFILFLTVARGTVQWAIAGLGFIMGLGGAVVMAAGELILGQQLVAVDNVEQIGWILVGTTIAAALVHALLSYLFHLTEPSVWNRIENNQKIAAVQEKAYQSARAEIDRQADDMGKDLAASLVYQARAELAAAALPHLRQGAQIETLRSEALSTDLVIPPAKRQENKIGLAMPRWPRRPVKQSEPTYTPVEMKSYAADTVAVSPLDLTKGGA